MEIRSFARRDAAAGIGGSDCYADGSFPDRPTLYPGACARWPAFHKWTLSPKQHTSNNDDAGDNAVGKPGSQIHSSSDATSGKIDRLNPSNGSNGVSKMTAEGLQTPSLQSRRFEVCVLGENESTYGSTTERLEMMFSTVLALAAEKARGTSGESGEKDTKRQSIRVATKVHGGDEEERMRESGEDNAAGEGLNGKLEEAKEREEGKKRSLKRKRPEEGQTTDPLVELLGDMRW